MDAQQIFARLRSLTSSFSGAQLATLAGAFVLVVGIVTGSAYWLNKPTYALLFADMDPETAGQIVTRLKTLNVVYQLDAGGRGIRVPADRVDELRLELTAEGMPQSGRVGFEIFDRTAFGATEFLEQVNYRRALEGELARTVGTISEVASARVHIAMGKDSVFGESRPAKASVVLKLRGQRSLPASTVSGISNLVAASVEGLRPESVVIIDSLGRPLARPEGDANDPMGAAQSERQQRLEREMASRVVALLEPVVGPDRVRVNIALRLNPQTLEETEERWDPNAVVRSRQMTADIAAAAAAASGQVAGARSNTPPATPPQATTSPAAAAPPLATLAGTGPSSSRSAETTNYEISRTTRHTLQPPGEVARLSVAVIIDDDQVASKDDKGVTTISRAPRKPEELEKIQGLVAAAVGLEPARGDQITVHNVSFDEPIVEEGTPPTVLERYAPQVWEGSRMLVIALLGLMALMIFVRPLMRRAGGAAGGRPALAGGPTVMPAVGQPLRTVADLESEIEAQIDAASAQRLEARRLPVLTRRATAMTQKEPENVARLLRSWMSEPER